MGLVKSDIFSVEQNEIANIAKALGHPARIAILEFLLSNESCVCGDIVENIPLAQATISQHLAELKKVGLITGEIKPPRVCYCINQEKWEEVESLFKMFFNKKVQLTAVCC